MEFATVSKLQQATSIWFLVMGLYSVVAKEVGPRRRFGGCEGVLMRQVIPKAVGMGAFFVNIKIKF